MQVCEYCLQALESHGEKLVILEHEYINAFCDFCEDESEELYTVEFKIKKLKKLRFHRDGYDYIASANGNEYCISKAYDVWCVWVNDEKQKEFFDYIADAKDWCQNHSKKEMK